MIITRNHSFFNTKMKPTAEQLDSNRDCMVFCTLQELFYQIPQSQRRRKAAFSEEIFNYQNQALLIGEDRFLNYQFFIQPLYHLKNLPKNKFFIKPLKHVKTFAGHVMEDYHLTKNTWNIQDQELCIVSEHKEVKNEVRFFISENRIVDQSHYPEPKEISMEDHIEFVKGFLKEEPIELSNLGRYVMDVCESKGELKVVELNCFHTSGIYECSIEKILEECEELTRKENF